MRDFTKSLASFSWAMTAFGIQQTLNLFDTREGSTNEHPATEGFNNVAKATTDELGGFAESVFRAGNNLQQGLIDVTFEIFSAQGADTSGGGSRGRSDSSREDGVWRGRRARTEPLADEDDYYEGRRDYYRRDTRGRGGCGGCGSGW